MALYERMRDRIAQVPGVRRASFARVPPLSQSNWTTGVNVPGATRIAARENVYTNGADPEYFATLEIPLLLGRAFTARDDAAAPKVAIVNEAFARLFFAGETVIGQRIGISRAETSPTTEIVGVVRDAQYSGVKSAPPPTIFLPFRQLDGRNAADAHFVVRFSRDPAALAGAVHAAVRDVDPNLPVFNLRTQQEQIDRLFTQERLFAQLCTFFGGIALLLAAVGLYGLMSYAVVRRTGEIGLRMALGALPGQVLRMILRESLLLVAVGAVLGLGGAFAATRLIATMLFGLSPADPVTYGAVTALLVLVAALACLIPARRAARVDPMTALRTE